MTRERNGIGWRDVAAFAYVWLMTGFASGTLVLLGPVRWISSAGRSRGWSQGAEDLVVGAVIVLYVVGSAVLAGWLLRIARRSRRKMLRYGVPVVLTALAAGAVWVWMHPAMLTAGQGTEVVHESRFTFGPYPTRERMARLEAQGYTAVVSLLHPAVVPFEPKLLADERELAREFGIRFIHAPMLPWVGSNDDALETIRELAESGEGRYYVHCYLGKDRVSVVRRLVRSRVAEAGGGESGATGAGSSNPRRLHHGTRLERGEVIRLAEDVVLIPFPTDEEMFNYVVGGPHEHVLSLLDPDSEADLQWIEREREALGRYGLGLTIEPLPGEPFEPDRALAAARRAKGLPRPLLVHAFLTESIPVEAFRQAFLADLPPLPPSIFYESLENGEVRVVAPNVAVGPRPVGREFGAQLFNKGIRRVAYLGRLDAPEALEDRRLSRIAGLEWSAFDGDREALLRAVSDGGPWYVYGPKFDGVARLIAQRLGPAVPDLPARGIRARASVQRQGMAPMALVGLPGEAWMPESVAAFVDEALPSVEEMLLLGPALLLYAVVWAWLVGYLRTARDVRTAYTRKIYHFAIFTLAGVVHLVWGLSAVMLFGTITALCVLFAVFRGDGFPFYEAMARPSDAPRRSMFVLVPLATTALGGVLSNLVFAPVAYVGYLVCGWGDAVAEPVGARWGRHRYRVPSLAGVAATRSLEGSASVLLVGSVAAFLGLWGAGVAPAAAAATAAAAGCAGTLVEAFSNHGIDNLTIQLAASAAAFYLL